MTEEFHLINMINQGSGAQIGQVNGDITINNNVPPTLEAKLDTILGLIQPRSDFEIMNYDPASIIRPVLAVGNNHLIALRDNGRPLRFGFERDKYIDISSWQNIVAVGATREGCVGLRSDGTCVAIGQYIVGNGDIFRWKNVISVACGAFHALALHSDGKVSACGMNLKHQCEVDGWRDVKAISCGTYHSVGLKNDGTVVAVGDNFYGQCNVEMWKNVIQVAAGLMYTVGLTDKDKIIIAPQSMWPSCGEWSNIKSIASGLNHIVALKQDGAVVSTGLYIHGQANVGNWDHIIAVAAGFNATAGLQSDGKIVVTNDKYTQYTDYVDINIDNWRLFKGEKVGLSRYNQALNKIKAIIDTIDCEIQKCRKLILENSDSFSSVFKAGLYSSAKSIWEMNTECSNMPDIHQQIILHSAALADFIEALDKIGPKDSVTFKLTEKACAVFIMYESIFQQVKANISELYARENKQGKEIEILY